MVRAVRLAIDASNIRAGGGVTHLVEVLRAADPSAHGFERVSVWACAATLAQLADRPWLDKRTDPVLEENFLRRALWQRTRLDKLTAKEGADLMFVPGGSIFTRMRPVVTMSRNMLPFEWRELRRFGFSLMTLKLLLLRWTQAASFKKADGTIFLTRYAHDAVVGSTGPLKGRTSIIPHGINSRFRRAPRPQRSLEALGPGGRIRIIYVSMVDVYKHQWTVAEAVGRLRREGLPVELYLYGPARASVLPRLEAALELVDPKGEFAYYKGPVDHKEVDQSYASADIGIFASSCENMPNILLESMAAGLPIACSDRGPMPEVLGGGGVYFDPEDASSIADAVRVLINDPELRAGKARAAFEAAQAFTWERCAADTFAFLAEVARGAMRPSAIAADRAESEPRLLAVEERYGILP